ncbi:MAG: proton-conducting transporter membrane subunit [Anaerolineaceae bacterium]
MSTPLIWIIIPIALAVLLIPLQGKPKLSYPITCLISLILTLLAWFFPNDLVFLADGRRIEIADQILIFGRSLQLEGVDLTMVGLLYLVNFLWNLGGSFYKPSTWFNTLSLIITALWITALAVQPFLYAAVVVELIALLSVPLLSPRGEKTSRGLLYYLVFQTLAMALILMSGWMLSGIGTAPSTNPLIIRSAMMVLFGFALWLGAFPFHSWIPIISQHGHPWVVTFLLYSMQTTLVVFFLYFLDQYAWLRSLPQLYESLQLMGVIMIAVAGILAALQTNLSRQFAYFFLAETGYSILSIGLTEQGGLSYLVMLFLPRMLSYWLWAWSISALRKLAPEKNLELTSLAGLFQQFPFISAGILASQLSLIGLPLLPIFPVKQMIWYLVPYQGMGTSPWIVLGILGMLISMMRFVRQFSTPVPETTEKPVSSEPLSVVVPICIILVIFLVIGLFPQLALPKFVDILAPFVHLLPSS